MQLEVADLSIDGVKVIKARKFSDDRGFFSEVYSRRDLAEAGIHVQFVQDNHSLSIEKGTLRGLHFQAPPFAQDKLVRVTRGAVVDVVVDLRESSPTFGKYTSATLSADNWNQIFVPIGFAHGFMTLEVNTEVLYKVSNFYSQKHDMGVLWNDAELAIDWPQIDEVRLSDKDKRWPRLSEIPKIFPHENPQ